MKYDEDEIMLMKYKWKMRQYKRVSNYAILYGPRESAKKFWNNIFEDYNNTKEEEIVKNTDLFSKIKKFLKSVYK